ncbi:ACT domain-containing protein [Candidatus Sumerlaeota bacterium]|nr:ACT domain-containing protein [Candidatus Sumerlaeota bacterium]
MAALLHQFSVRVPNKPGFLANLCRILKEAEVNILAVSVHDSTDSGIIRFVPDKPDIIDDLLTQNKYCYDVKNVIMLTLENVPGALWKVAQVLSSNKINIDYLYTANHPDVERTVTVISTQECRKALKLLKDWQ